MRLSLLAVAALAFAAGEANGQTVSDKHEVAILAGGCFWGMEDLIRKIPGVIDTEAGYSGGTTSGPKYEDVHTGRSGHAEAVQVVSDPAKLSYEQLLGWFFRM